MPVALDGGVFMDILIIFSFVYFIPVGLLLSLLIYKKNHACHRDFRNSTYVAGTNEGAIPRTGRTHYRCGAGLKGGTPY